MATAWGGSSYPWTSTHVLIPLIIGPILFLAFFRLRILLEPDRTLGRRFPKTIGMIPWHLFSRRDTLLLAIVNFAAGAAMYSVFYFVGLYFQIAQGLESSQAGLYLLYYIPGLGTGTYMTFFHVQSMA